MGNSSGMPPGWRVESVGTLISSGAIAEIQDGNHGELHPKSSDYVSSGVPFVMARDLKNGRLDLGDCAFISRQLADSLRVGFARPGDVLLTHKATMGRVAVVPDGFDYIMLTPQVTYYRIGDEQQLSGSYLKYAFLSPGFQHQLNADSDQSTRKYIGISGQRRLTIPLPPLPEQRAIAHILGTLDDKIELNRRMNETLEAIARAIFKSWFVDFDPVRAKAEGRDTDLPPHIADLFPDSFEDSELGEIPSGWRVRSLDDIANFLNGLALQKYPPTGLQSLPVIKIAQLRAGNTQGADAASANLEPDYVVEDGDVLFSWSGSLECVLWAGGRGALNQHLFKVNSDRYPKWLYYLWTHHHLAEFRLIAAGKATTMGHIQRHHLTDAKVVLPHDKLMTASTEIIGPMIESIWKREVQSRSLAEVRGALLPKLISGELRVGDAERFVDEVTA